MFVGARGRRPRGMPCYKCNRRSYASQEISGQAADGMSYLVCMSGFMLEERHCIDRGLLSATTAKSESESSESTWADRDVIRPP
eukprot:233768-Amphidinium_carterae.1